MHQIPKIVIYGVNQQAAQLCVLIEKEEQAIVEAFIIDKDYKTCDEFCSKPVVTSDMLEEMYPNDTYSICLSFGYKNMVHNREAKFNWCKEKGYSIYTFISKNAILYTDTIGEGCNIYPGTILSPFVKVGRGNFIEAGCVIAHDTKLGDFNFIAPGVHFCGDVTTGANCFFGGAAEIVNGVVIGDEVFVGAAAKVSRNIEAKSAILPAQSTCLGNKAFEIMEKMFKGEK